MPKSQFIDPVKVSAEETSYRDLPTYYDLGSYEEKGAILRNNMFRINQEAAAIVKSFQ